MLPDMEAFRWGVRRPGWLAVYVMEAEEDARWAATRQWPGSEVLVRDVKPLPVRRHTARPVASGRHRGGGPWLR